jgi:putative oxidoreductase
MQREDFMGALAPLGRFFFSAIFILSGFAHLTNAQAMIGYAKSAGLPLPALGVYASGVLLVVGGLCVLLDDFWNFTGMEAQVQRSQFLKNISLMGGALLVVLFGPGPYSVRARSRVLERSGWWRVKKATSG